MEFAVVHTSLLLILSFILCIAFLFRGKKKYSGRLPPGSLGLPFIGQSKSFYKALKDDKLREWFLEKIEKHGPISKTHLFGYPTIYLHGAKANKFLYTYDGNILTNIQPPSTSRLIGKTNLLELIGDEHKRLRTAMLSFLKLDVLKLNFALLDEEIQHHIQMHWHGKHEVQVQPLTKILTFNMICSLVFGVERGPKRERLLPHFEAMFEALLAIPINFPFTTYNRGIAARNKLIPMVVDLIHEKEEALEQNQADTHKDLISHLLSFREDPSEMFSNEQIIDTVVGLMAAGYETTSTLLTFFIRVLASNKSIYNSVVQEHKEIVNSKPSGEALTWQDLTKMNYTWNVASELLRMYPPVALSWRRAMDDIEYEGFIIPKGWQVVIYAGMTHMDANIFRNPSKVDPARFEKNAQPPPPFALVPFGAGPRMCPGIDFAKIETLIVIHHLVTNFTWELLNEDEPFKRIPMPTFVQGLKVRIKPIK